MDKGFTQVTTSRNLLPGQYQLGNTIFGKYTNIKVENFDPQSYNVTAQDMQQNRSDEIGFGIDSLQAQPITMRLSVLDNRVLPSMTGYTGLTLPPGFDLRGQETLDRLGAEWKSNDMRSNWGAAKPLFCCGRDGVTRVVYGRPRKFKQTKRSESSEGWSVDAEFMRLDTLCYREDETVMEIMPGAAPTYAERTEGNAPAWLRIYGEGPITHPIVTIGDQQVELDMTIAEGEAFEVSSYPWRRRSIDSNRRNLGALLIGETQYLDRLILPPNTRTPVRWTSSGVNTWTPALGTQAWSESIDNLDSFNLSSAFATIGGKVVVALDLLNFGNPSFPWLDMPQKFIRNALLESTSAVRYDKDQFSSARQYCEAKLVNPINGRSGIAIMSNDAMTNYVVGEVKTAIGGNYLRIRTGTAYNTYSSVRAEWQNTAPLGFSETDTVGIGFDPDAGAGTFRMYLNGDEKCSWEDTGNVVNRANRKQAFIFDMDGDLLTTGVGFKDIIAYDFPDSGGPPVTGKIFVAWRDAWDVII